VAWFERTMEDESGATMEMALEPGMAVIAPGDFHMVVENSDRLRVFTNQQPPVHSSRPAVDVLFASVAAAIGSKALGVVLTGMGRDGEAGAAAIREQGGRIVIQDEESRRAGGGGGGGRTR
jgi:two-component system chemotaxis response regulator CheB